MVRPKGSRAGRCHGPDTSIAATNGRSCLHWDQSNSFWLVLADQFEKRGISSRRVRKTALDIIDGGKDAATMQALGMKPADIRQRARKLAELPRRTPKSPTAHTLFSSTSRS